IFSLVAKLSRPGTDHLPYDFPGYAQVPTDRFDGLALLKKRAADLCNRLHDQHPNLGFQESWKPMWTLCAGVPIGSRSPRKGGPFCMPIHRLAEGTGHNSGMAKGTTARAWRLSAWSLSVRWHGHARQDRPRAIFSRRASRHIQQDDKRPTHNGWRRKCDCRLDSATTTTTTTTAVGRSLCNAP